MATSKIREIEEIHGETQLDAAVREWVNRQAGVTGVAGVARDLFTGGCASGYVGELIYTRDSERFALRHMVDILAMWQEDADEFGARPMPSKGTDLDLNWLAWYGFEAAARRLFSRAGVEH